MAADSKFKTAKDLIEAGRKEPNIITASVSSATGTGRLLLYLIERGTGAKFKYVLFKSGSEAAVAVAGGHVTLHARKPERDAGSRREQETKGDRRIGREAPGRGARCADH